MSNTTNIAVKPSRQHPFLARHPWVHLSSLIDDQVEPPCGTIVDLVSHDGQWIARGLYNPASALRVRLYTWNRGETLDATFFCGRIREAIARRKLMGLDEPNGAARMVFSEADGLSGLIVDRYADALSVQVTAAAIEPYLNDMLDCLLDTCKPRAIVLRVDGKQRVSEQFQSEEGVVRGSLGEETTASYLQNGLQLEVDLLYGQKTGAYLDQRDNHKAVAKYALGRDVLDICCHTGGFGLVAAAAGATSVLGIDSSQNALAAARRNAAKNNLTSIEFQSGDCFDTLVEYAKQGRKFGMVVLDPPRMASTHKHVESAMRAYYRLNRSALDLIDKGGILVTCSCSGRVTRSDFLNNLVEVGRRAQRDIIVLENRSASADHPMRVSCPESDYLKCLICEIV